MKKQIICWFEPSTTLTRVNTLTAPTNYVVQRPLLIQGRLSKLVTIYHIYIHQERYMLIKKKVIKKMMSFNINNNRAAESDSYTMIDKL